MNASEWLRMPVPARVARRIAINWKRETLYLRARLAVAEHHIRPLDYREYLNRLRTEGLDG